MLARAVATPAAMLALAAALPGVAAAKGHSTRLSASLPSSIARGHVLSAHGRLKGGPRGARVVLQQRGANGWRSRTRARPNGTRFSLRWRVPVHPQIVTLRVAAVRGSRTLASTTPRRVWIKGPVHAVEPGRVASAPPPGSPGEVRYNGLVSLPAHSIVATGVGAATPYGFLGEVVSTRVEGGNTVASTLPTTLLAAVPQGSIDVTAGDTSAGKHGARKAAAEPLSQQIAKNFSCEAGGQMELSGSVSIRPKVAFSAHWSLLHGVDRASFTGSVTASASLSASADGSASCQLERTPLLAHPWVLDPIDIQVGPVPVVIVPEVQVYVSGDGKVTAKVTTGVDASASASAGLSYDHGHVSPISSFDQSFGYTQPSVTSSAHLGGALAPTLDLLLYGAGGPEVTFSAGLSFDADPSASPWWTLTAPVDLGAKLSIPILGIDTKTWHVFHHDYELAHADTSGPGGGGGGTGGGSPPSAPLTGPLTVGSADRQISNYYATADLSCNLTTAEDDQDEFYVGSGTNDACGTFLAIDGQLYGPATIPAGDDLGGYTPWTPVSQAQSGDGSAGDPYTTVTTVAAGDTGVQLTETDRWLAGGAVVDSTYNLASAPGDTRAVELYRGADCFAGGSDDGTGSYDAGTQSAGCLQDNGDGTAVDEALVPVTGGAQSAEDYYKTIWADIATQQPLPGGALTDPSYDNGEATSWALSLNGTSPVAAESRFDFHTVAFP